MTTTPPSRFFSSLDALLDRPMRVTAVLSFGILVLHWAVVIAFIYARLGTLDFLRLHYTATEGVDWSDHWQFLLIFPGFGFAVFFTNLFVACVLARRRKTLGRIVLVATVIVEALLAVGGTIAVLLNG